MMSVTDLVFRGLLAWLDRYIIIQSLKAIVSPHPLSTGSCNATRLIPIVVRCVLLMMSYWQVGDLLMFCCQMDSLCINGRCPIGRVCVISAQHSDVLLHLIHPPWLTRLVRGYTFIHFAGGLPAIFVDWDLVGVQVVCLHCEPRSML